MQAKCLFSNQPSSSNITVLFYVCQFCVQTDANNENSHRNNNPTTSTMNWKRKQAYEIKSKQVALPVPGPLPMLYESAQTLICKIKTQYKKNQCFIYIHNKKV